MSSKRMAISALLSNDASTSPQPPSPAPAPASDEPPLKRQRQHQGYSQRYYDSYNAYPYSPHSSSSPTSRYYPPPHSQPPSQSPRSGSPHTAAAANSPPAWPPQHHPPTHTRPAPRTQWDAGPRYTPANAGEFDFVRPRAQTNSLRTAEDDVVEGARDARFHPPSMRKGQSIGGVLTDQMRAPQTHTALPVPPQLRRDAQHSQISYVAPTLKDSPPLAPVRTRDASPLTVKIATPRTTPPTLSPLSSYASQHISPTPSYTTQSASPTAYTPHTVSPSMHSRQNASPATYTSPKVSPTTAAYPSSQQPHMQYAPTVSPSTSQAPPFTRVSPSTSHAHTSESPTTSYTPLSLRPPSCPPPSRDPVVTPVSERAPPPAPPPPPPPSVPPPLVSVSDRQPPTPKPPQSAAMHVDDERSFEDELLSLVDGEDIKPKIPRPASQFPPPESLVPPANRKPTGLSSKPAPKAKQPPKPRAPAKSAKAKAAAKQASATGTPLSTSSMPPPSPPPTKQQPAVARAKGKAAATKKKASTARSRSLSVKPVEPTPIPGSDIEMAREDDRLYCVCRTPYDEDKIMIACDRCDEWYHPACIGMPEIEVDLVDQYICSPCGKQKAGLKTTYKRRCHRGLKYIASHDTLPTCWKPARGAFSKYCSDDCGTAHMRAKILQSGRDTASLWPAVKDARRREGVTVTNRPVKTEEADQDKVNDLERKKAALAEARKALKEADERELAELLRRLDEVMNARETCKASLELVMMRRRLLDIAEDRETGQCCGWDARLEMNDEEWTRWATTEEGRRALEGQEGDDEEKWRCQGPEVCPRHNGWRTIRDSDVQFEVDSKNSSIKQLTDRERELRRRIEDINPPSAPARQHSRLGGRKKNQGKRSAR